LRDIEEFRNNLEKIIETEKRRFKDPKNVKKVLEFDKLWRDVLQEIQDLSKTVSGKMIAQVGAISANKDTSIGEIIADAMDKVGEDGVITVEEGKSLDTVLDFVEGMQFDRGFLSPYFVTDADRMEAILEDPFILLHDKKISNLREMLPLLEQIAKTGKSFIIIAVSPGFRDGIALDVAAK